MPRGAIQHFRYLHPYIDDSLRKLLRSETEKIPAKLHDLSVVVVYVYQEQKSGRWQAEGPYLPLRCGRLVSAFSEGEVAHFYFETQDYIKINKRGDSARTSLTNRGIRFRTNGTKKAYPSFAHLGMDLNLAASKGAQAEAFQRFVYKCYRPGEWRTRSLGSTPLDVSYDVVFARIAGLYAEGGKRLKDIAPAQRMIRGDVSAEYVLEAGIPHHLKIITHLPAQTPAQLAGLGTAQIKLVYDPAAIRPLGPTNLRISSPYDLEYWSFVPIGSDNQRSTLTLACDHQVVSDRENFVRREVLWPEISLPIRIIKQDSNGIGRV